MSEHIIQANFVKWVRYNEKRLPLLRLGFAVPNGGHRDIRVAAKMKAEGVRRGVPDWMLPVPAFGFCGLAIEFKTATGRLTPEQQEFLDLLTRVGWLCVVCRDWQAAAKSVDDYLRNE